MCDARLEGSRRGCHGVSVLVSGPSDHERSLSARAEHVFCADRACFYGSMFDFDQRTTSQQISPKRESLLRHLRKPLAELDRQEVCMERNSKQG